MGEKNVNANPPEPDQAKLSFGSDPAMYNVESVGNTSNNSDGVLSKNENAKNQDLVNVVLNKFLDMNLDENMKFVPEDQKDEKILDLNNQINDLEKQLEERREWAQDTALKAARRLCNDLSDLKMLRMESEETQGLKASGQFGSANADVIRLETENSEIRAEIEASNLSASESVTTYLEISKKEKQFMKRLGTWEKQKTKMKEEIAAEKLKILELQQQMLEMEEAKKDAEAKWREEQKKKLLAAAQVEEERRLKEAAEASIKTRQESLRLEIEIDLKRLEQELSRLKASAEFTQQSPNPPIAESLEETIAKLLDELNNLRKKL